MKSGSVEIALPEEAAARRAFARAAATWGDADFIHERARENLLGRLDYLRLSPRVVVDVGCGTGRGLRELRARYPDATLLGLDTSLAMCRRASRETAVSARATIAAGHGEHLPLGRGTAELILANLCLPWCRPDRLFHEVARTLSPDGLFLFSTIGPETLGEVRRAWAEVDDRIHVHAAFEMHDLGDLAAAAGLREPVLDVDRLSIRYPDVPSLVRDLRACGGVNTAAGRRRTLTGRDRWRAFVHALTNASDGRGLEVTLELIYGQGWGSPAGERATPETVSETRVPVGEIGRR